jgi:hypothetical protein
VSVNRRREISLGKTSKKGHPVFPTSFASLEEELGFYINRFRHFSTDYRRRVTDTKLRRWERTFREAATGLLKIEPFIRHNGGGPIDLARDRRRGTDDAVNLLREAADYLHSLPLSDGGPNIDFDEVWCVAGMCRAYINRRGKPQYRLVTRRMRREFPVLFKKKPKSELEWARARLDSWDRLQEDPKAFERVTRQRTLGEILKILLSR